MTPITRPIRYAMSQLTIAFAVPLFMPWHYPFKDVVKPYGGPILWAVLLALSGCFALSRYHRVGILAMMLLWLAVCAMYAHAGIITPIYSIAVVIFGWCIWLLRRE